MYVYNLRARYARPRFSGLVSLNHLRCWAAVLSVLTEWQLPQRLPKRKKATNVALLF